MNSCSLSLRASWTKRSKKTNRRNIWKNTSQLHRRCFVASLQHAGSNNICAILCNTCAYCKEGNTNGTTNLLRQALGSSSNPSSSNDHKPPYPHQKSHDIASQATTRSCLLLFSLGGLWLWINKLSSEVFTADLIRPSVQMQAACTNKTWWCWIVDTFSVCSNRMYMYITVAGL